ncbi:tRNA pseudouridine(54/55) synthase Pus10 [Candidatus Bathyarchaeota archaeon A05DMB-2]|jgi:tRNA pseudouridine synthase 10|nr:tRNA pseudouridine(54/55) synthase Pus10 [Candidatus Bathyarchaeota archaeon A05DMB-2]
MDVMEKALLMLEKYPLCDHCLGRQFALLGYNIENDTRGKALKLSLTLQANAFYSSKQDEGTRRLKVLATNGFSPEAQTTLKHLKKRVSKKSHPQACFLCEGKFQLVEELVQKALVALAPFEYFTFLVGVEVPVTVEEREDEFKAEFEVSDGESMRHEFGRVLGKALAERNGKEVEYKKPDIVVVINPFTEHVRLQVNPLFIAGRYRKLVRDIPQSKWFCSSCRGRGCAKCGGTGKMYPESVEELISKPLLAAAGGEKSSFHASGREDIDARMLGSGRPFVLEISKPKKRFLDLKQLEGEVNAGATGKVEVSRLRFANKELVRRLKKGESAQKEYRVLVEFENPVSEDDLHLLEEKLTDASVKQQTPLRVLHRRADLTREKYIYKVKVKKVSPNRAELEIRCQGGLYVKELVSGDEGRTTPSVTDLLGNRAKPLKLDVLNVIVDDE